MEESVFICPSCGKQNPANARFCYACGATLSAGVTPTETGKSADPQDAGAPFSDQETQIPAAAYSKPQPQYVPPAPQVYPPAPTPETYYPPKPRKRGRVRCCAVGCLVVLLVLLIGLPILHVTVLRPLIEGAIYKQVSNSLEDVGSSNNIYYGTDTENITERQINDDAKSAWDYLPGSTDGHIYLQQDQIRLEVKFYGVNVWAAADLRVNNRGEFVIKSMKMHWLLNVLFSESALKRELAKTINEKIVRPKGLFMLAFQVSEGKLFVAYESR
jgi:hypothetical protein